MNKDFGDGFQVFVGNRRLVLFVDYKLWSEYSHSKGETNKNKLTRLGVWGTLSTSIVGAWNQFCVSRYPGERRGTRGGVTDSKGVGRPKGNGRVVVVTRGS